MEVRIGGANGPIAKLYADTDGDGVGDTIVGDATGITNSSGFFKIGGSSGGLIDGQIYTIVVKKSGFVNAVAENVVISGLTDIGTIGLSPELPLG